MNRTAIQNVVDALELYDPHEMVSGKKLYRYAHELRQAIDEVEHTGWADHYERQADNALQLATYFLEKDKLEKADMHLKIAEVYHELAKEARD